MQCEKTGRQKQNQKKSRANMGQGLAAWRNSAWYYYYFFAEIKCKIRPGKMPDADGEGYKR